MTTRGSSPPRVTPRSSLLYLGLTLDTESEQWALADELLQRAGSEESILESLDQASSTATGQDLSEVSEIEAVLGGEAALVVHTLDTVTEQASGIGEIGGIDLPDAEGGDDASAGAAVIIQPSDIEATMTEVDRALDEDAADAGVTVEETDYNGTTIRSIAPDEAAGEDGQAIARVGDFVVIGTTVTDVEPIVDAANGDVETLDGSDAFNRASEALAGDRLAFGFVNGEAIASAITEADTSGLGLGESVGGLVGASVNQGLALIADPVGFRLNTVELALDGRDAVAGGRAADLDFDERVPADTLIFVNGFDLGRTTLFESLGLVAVSALAGLQGSDEAPAATPTAEDLYEAAEQLIGINLKADLLDQLVGQYGFALWDVDLEDPTQIKAILSSEVDTAASVETTLSTLSLLVQAAAQGEANVTTRTIGDASVSTVTIGEEGATPIVVEYGIVGGEFLLGVGDGIAEYAAGPDGSLADNEDYQTALAALPEEHDGIFFVNVAAAVELGESAMGSDATAFEDNSSSCAEYSSQEEAQAAYDEDSVANFDLDLDFDGQACEDFFGAATPEASPVAESQYSAVRSFATVSYKEDGLAYTNSILVIEEE